MRKKRKKRLEQWQKDMIYQLSQMGFCGWVIAECARCSEGSVHNYKAHSLSDYRRGETGIARTLMSSVSKTVGGKRPYKKYTKAA